MPNPGTCNSHCEKENDDDEETVEVRLCCIEFLARGGRRTRARAREREREASRPTGLGHAREESEGEEAPRVSRVSATPRLREGGFFAYRAAEPRLEHGVLPPRLVLLPVETHDGWCVRPQT